MAEMDSGKKMIQKAYDGWSNVLTGLGIKGQDKRMSAVANYEKLSQNDAENLYASDDMASKIIDLLPEEMMREGFDVETKDKDSQDISENVSEQLKELGLDAKLEEALKWARLYGGSLIVMGINDGQESYMPVNENNIKSIDYLGTLTRYEAHPKEIDGDPESPMFGLPISYSISPLSSTKSSSLEIHASRVLRFDGAKLPRRLQISNSYWHDSVLTKIYNPLRSFHAAHDSASSLVQDYAQTVFKMKNLTEMIAMGKDGLVEKRLALIDKTRSVVKSIVIEDGEDFERKTTNLGGLTDVLKSVDQRLVQAASTPHTILLGESPSGLGATGNSEKTDWYDYVSRSQEIGLSPQIEKITKYLFLSKEGPTKGVKPETWDVVFRPLWQMDERERAEINKVKADTDIAYINVGVLDPSEVAIARFGSVESEINIELESRVPQKPDEPLPSKKEEKKPEEPEIEQEVE